MLKQGEPRLVNVFASWCIPCVAEAPQLMALKRRGIPIDAVAIRDRPEDVAAFLAKWGDPYERIGGDPQTQVQIALGSAGVPETFIVDGNGIIRHQHIGDIRPEHMEGIVRAYEAAK
jgi:cytochrome c biogenesis protein CcmG/thiol:disulfide interchange protein DsbE